MTVEERMNDILDKKLDGIELTELEKEFLDSFEKGTTDEVNAKFDFITYENNDFSLLIKEVKNFGDKTHYIGTLIYSNYEFNIELIFNNNDMQLDYNCDYKGIDLSEILDLDELAEFHIFIIDFNLSLN